MNQANDGLLFEAVIVPHRSLSRRGLIVVAGMICTINLGVTTLFWALGAWPVAGFNGVEVILAVALLRQNARGGRAREIVALYEQDLRVTRTDPHGRRSERTLSPAWLNVVLEERQGRVPALWLAARGTREEVGASLGETEKRDLAEALREALQRWRSPVFDNPQLRS